MPPNDPKLPVPSQLGESADGSHGANDRKRENGTKCEM